MELRTQVDEQFHQYMSQLAYTMIPFQGLDSMYIANCIYANENATTPSLTLDDDRLISALCHTGDFTVITRVVTNGNKRFGAS